MALTGAGRQPVCYAFGDSDAAARRLELLNQVFAGSTRAFLERTAGAPLRRAVDLGCGPGYSTHILAERLQCELMIGIDNSDRFISLARRRETEKIRFHLHDFTCTPFPGGPADLLYARFELSHVNDPASVIERWSTQLEPGARLLLEETEWIQTKNSVFATYLRIVEAMLDSQGMTLYVGRDLRRLPIPARLRRQSNDLARFYVCDRVAARLFVLNIRTWKHHPFVQANYSSSVIEELERELAALAMGPGQTAEIEWGLRQLVLERR